MAKLPFEEVVALPFTKSPPDTESRVVEALASVVRPETERVVKEPAPPDEMRQVFPIAKQPEVRLIPFAKVEVAPVTKS